MEGFLRAITGNSSPLYVVQPSKEEQLDCGAYPVRFSGPAGKDSDDSEGVLFPRRFFFLLRGSVSCCDVKGLWLARPALQKAVENQSQNRHTMFLGPNIQIERTKESITLKYDEHWFEELTFKMMTDELYFNGVPLRRFAWKIEFNYEEDAKVWETAIRLEIATSFLTIAVSSDLEDAASQKLLDELIWLRIFQGNASLFYLYVSLTESTEKGVAPIDRTDNRSGAAIFDRLFDVTKKLIDPGEPKFEETFAFVLDTATTFDAVDRVLLLMCDIRQEVLPHGFGAGATNASEESKLDPVSASPGRSGMSSKLTRATTSQDPDRVVRFLMNFLKLVPNKASIRQALLCVFHHPGYWSIPEPAACAPRAADDESTRPVVDWNKEIGWYKDNNKETRRVTVDLSKLALLRKSPLHFLYLAMQQLCRSKLEGLSDAGRDKKAMRDIFVDILETNDLEVEFEAPVNGVVISAHHFIRLLLSTNLDENERTTIVVDMVAAGRMNKKVFRMILAEGLSTKSYETLQQLVCATLFHSMKYTQEDFLVKSVKCIRDFPMIIHEELWSCLSSKMLDLGDFSPLLLSFALRAENCTRRIADLKGVSVTTLSKWVHEDNFGARSREINSILERCQIAKYLRGKSSLHLSQNAPATNNVPLSSASNDALSTHDYSKKPLEDCILGLMCVSVITKSGEFISFVNLVPGFFETSLWRCRLRTDAIGLISNQYALRAEVKRQIEKNLILNEGRHFHTDALDLMTLASEGVHRDVVSGLIVMALKLQDYDNMKSRVLAVISGLSVARETKEPMMVKILTCIGAKEPEKLTAVSIEDMMSCVNNAVTALALLKNLVDERVRLNLLFDYYLDKEEVAAWPGLFKSAHSIAMFIKYLSREDIDKAYALFAERNAGNADFLTLLKEVYCVHSVPVVSAVEMSKIVKLGTSVNVVEALLKSVFDRSAVSRNAKRKFIGEVSVVWMRLMFAKFTIPMAPKNTQIIAMSACAQWLTDIYAKRLADRTPKFGALIAQVGTGEGKSLIIAMLAVYCVKILKKKVHILENNVGLLEKDYSTFCCDVNKNNVITESFYGALKVTASKALSEQKDVTYCQRAGMENFYREGVFASKQPFENTVLIVDEVDELIVDKDPNTSYVRQVTGSSVPLKKMFDLLRESEGRGQPQPGYDPQMWAMARDAYQEAMRKNKGPDYNAYDGSRIFLVEKLKESQNSYALWLEYLRYRADRSYTPNVKTTFFYQNITHMMTQYDAIVGLSGSLGCSSEREFLRNTYNAACFEVPSFLDTCEGDHKHKPRLIRNVVEIYADEASHTAAIIREVLAMYSTVPVLIVTKSPDAAKMLATRILNRLQKPEQTSKHGNEKPEEFVQLFLEQDNNGKPMSWLNIIEKATGVISAGLPRRITVTDAFGGRGHDFLVNDESADDHGGLALIVTLMPESERDWTQWLGRTARNDRKGQYAVILRADESPIKNSAELLRKHRISKTEYKPTIIDNLLELRDAESLTKINEMKEKVRRGQRLNELCDRYYRKYNKDATGDWPGVPENQQLSLFLDNYNSHTQSGIQAFAASMGVHYVSAYDN